MKKRKPMIHLPREKRYNGIFDPEREDLELDAEIVSANEMTGAVPAARQEPYDDDAFEEYYF